MNMNAQAAIKMLMKNKIS